MGGACGGSAGNSAAHRQIGGFPRASRRLSWRQALPGAWSWKGIVEMRMRAAVLATAVLAMAAPAHAQSSKAQNIDAQIDRLTQRVEQLEGTRAVKKLQRAFGYYIDRGLWTEAADLFADDGTIEIGLDGVYAGKARIAEYLRRLH